MPTDASRLSTRTLDCGMDCLRCVVAAVLSVVRIAGRGHHFVPHTHAAPALEQGGEPSDFLAVSKRTHVDLIGVDTGTAGLEIKPPQGAVWVSGIFIAGTDEAEDSTALQGLGTELGIRSGVDGELAGFQHVPAVRTGVAGSEQATPIIIAVGSGTNRVGQLSRASRSAAPFQTRNATMIAASNKPLPPNMRIGGLTSVSEYPRRILREFAEGITRQSAGGFWMGRFMQWGRVLRHEERIPDFRQASSPRYPGSCQRFRRGKGGGVRSGGMSQRLG